MPAGLDPPDLRLRRDFLLAAVEPGRRLLDLGCGEGTFAALAADAGADVVGADVAPTAVARARRAQPELRFDRIETGAPLPYADNGFDVVWASEVIEHVADTARWLSEVRRVLVPRGVLLLTTPLHDRRHLAVHGLERYSPPLGDHLHLYTRRSLRDVLTEFGFGEIAVRAAGGLPGWRRVLLARAVR